MKITESFPKSYNIHCLSSTITKIGQDMRGIVNYDFNSQGFRANIEYDINEKKAVAFFGNLYCSAIGIEWKSSYAQKTCDNLQLKCYNFSQGCAGVDNNEIVRTVKHIVEMETFEPLCYIVQFCELERRFSQKSQGLTLEINQAQNIENFLEVFAQLEEILKGKKWMFFGIDNTLQHQLPESITEHKNCLCWNPHIIDKILQGIAGEKWHSMIAYGLTKRMKNDFRLA